MRLWLFRVLLALLIPVTEVAQAQFGKPDPLPPVTAAPAQPDSGSKPPPLPPTGGAAGTVAPQAPAAPPADGRNAPRCAQTLANGCLTQQSSCQIACPQQWSTNPSAPAFTPTDRAGCMGQCLQRYYACMRLYGCM
ncbi:hypothetical protein SAMN02927895_00531 [Belnapia rosea]|uniref:Uncharacterized protein n=1 Tax=Belnapia rosea TaxID=938405 RepID=A0A1G6K071_9PROT|nr:hypothetical protein SAMN02927895_00531 [Belnapia rosea]SDC24367.1 hypothetical protein SAMN04487779_1001339 [Belnapia rosea]